MTPEAHIIDDDPAVLDALHWLLSSRHVPARTWSNPHQFLGSIVRGMRGCVVLDVRIPEISGIELFDRLRAMNCHLPVIFLTGHGDVPMAVQAIKNGAFDFIEKPYDDNALVDKIIKAMAIDDLRIAQGSELQDVEYKLSLLTPREHDVMQRILSGKLNKIIADELCIAMRTVEVHRARIFEKMNVRSAVELSQLLARLADKSGY